MPAGESLGCRRDTARLTTIHPYTTECLGAVTPHPAVLVVLMIASDDNTRDVAAGREDLPATLPNCALTSPDQR